MEHIILYVIVPIVAVMLAGYISGRKGVFSGDDAKKFNKVVLNFALPAALFVSIVGASREMLYDDLKFTLVSIGVIMGCFMLVYFVFARCFEGNNGADGAVAALINGSPTIGFLGFAVLEPVFGATPAVALVVAIVGIVVNAIGIPVGLSLMNASLVDKPWQQKQGVWKPVAKALGQPVAWAPVLAVAMVLAGINWPAWLSPSFDLMSKANGSMAVFSAGITLSAIRIEINWQAILGSVMKLFLMPAVALIVGMLCEIDIENLYMLVVSCALPPAFSGIIIADESNVYVATGTSSLALSVILFIVTCPLWLWLTQLVAGPCPGLRI